MIGETRAAVVAVFVFAFAIAGDDARVFPAEIEGVEKPWAGEDAHGLLIEAIDTVHEAAGIEFAAQLIKALEQSCAVTEAVESDAVECHVIGPAAAIWLKGSVGDAEVSGVAIACPFHVTHLGREPDKGWHGGIGGTFELGNEGTKGGPSSRWLTLGTAAC